MKQPQRSTAHLLFAAWNWKAAAVSAVLRAGLFLATNRRSGPHAALHAATVEAVFAVLAAGVLGACTERLRDAQPVWATALAVWLGFPAIMVAAQFLVHRLAGTPHLRAGLIASFVFAAFASGFNWFAQRRGVLLAGEAPGQRTFLADLHALPPLLAAFLLAPFRTGPKGHDLP